MKLEKIAYNKLNSRGKENFNFTQLASKLAQYGVFCQKLADDWAGANLVAINQDGETALIQLKERFTVDPKY